MLFCEFICYQEILYRLCNQWAQYYIEQSNCWDVCVEVLQGECIAKESTSVALGEEYKMLYVWIDEMLKPFECKVRDSITYGKDY